VLLEPVGVRFDSERLELSPGPAGIADT
jgi:hypothetical protein